MSVLHRRLAAGPQMAAGSWHPYGTAATPMIMPVAHIAYGSGTGTYADLYPSVPATGDVNAVPLAVVAPGSWGNVVAAGRKP